VKASESWCFASWQKISKSINQQQQQQQVLTTTSAQWQRINKKILHVKQKKATETVAKNETDKQESQQLHMMRFVDLHHKHQQSQLAVEELEKKKSRFCLAKVIRIWRKTKQQWLMLLHEKWQHHHVPHLSIIIVVIVDRPCLLLHVQCEIN